MKKTENYIKTIRKNLGLTQKQLAEKLNINPNYVYLLESGKNQIGKKTLEKLKKLEAEHQRTLESEPSNESKKNDITFCVQCAKKDADNQVLRERLLISTKRETQLADQVALLHKHLDDAFSIINTDRKNPAK